MSIAPTQHFFLNWPAEEAMDGVAIAVVLRGGACLHCIRCRCHDGENQQKSLDYTGTVQREILLIIYFSEQCNATLIN